MTEVSPTRIVPTTFRISNPLDSPLTVWIEPWAERFELKRDEELEVSLVGPNCGRPELRPGDRVLSIYAWQGCDFVAMQDGRVAGQQPNVTEILAQEIAIAGKAIDSNKIDWPVDDITELQLALDKLEEVTTEAQWEACRLAGKLIEVLANVVAISVAAEEFLWQVASRVVHTKGIVLIEPSSPRLEAALRKGSHESPSDLILSCAISTLPNGPNPTGLPLPAESTTQRFDAPQSDAISS